MRYNNVNTPTILLLQRRKRLWRRCRSNSLLHPNCHESQQFPGDYGQNDLQNRPRIHKRSQNLVWLEHKAICRNQDATCQPNEWHSLIKERGNGKKFLITRKPREELFFFFLVSAIEKLNQSFFQYRLFQCNRRPQFKNPWNVSNTYQPVSVSVATSRSPGAIHRGFPDE